MASTSMCSSCLRAMRQSGRKEIQHFNPRVALFQRHNFSTTRSAAVRMTIEDVREQTPTGTLDYKDPSTLKQFAQRMREQKQMRGVTEPYAAYGATEHLFRECARAGEYTMPSVKAGEDPPRTAKGEDLGVGVGWWYEELKLKPTFNTWAQVTFIHMYLLTVRLRLFPAEHVQTWHQNLLDHFSYAAEDRMAVYHGMSARSIRNRYLKDLFVRWRGVLAAYDEGIIKGDAVLGAAIWRNVFGADENVDAAQIAQVVAWFRRSLRHLDHMKDAEVAGGAVSFADPSSVLAVVNKESKLMKTPFSEADARAPRP